MRGEIRIGERRLNQRVRAWIIRDDQECGSMFFQPGDTNNRRGIHSFLGGLFAETGPAGSVLFLQCGRWCLAQDFGEC
jgi:hypothetical protein